VSWNPFGDETWDDGDGESGETDPGADADARSLGPGAPRPGRGWPEPDEDDLEPGSGRWPLGPRGLYPRERWLWFEQLWTDVCMLRERYRLALRAGWWEDSVQVEALAALAAWAERYDSGEWDDPPGKLALLYDLERVGALLRDGLEPFFPARDRSAFMRFLLESGCQPPPQGPGMG
jgi:hypothetical protein